MPGASQAAPLTPNGELKPRVMASTAFGSPSSGTTSVASASGLGASLIVASVRTPSVPWAPQLSLVRSRPVTFFITRPPQRIVWPRPLTSFEPEDAVAHRARARPARPGKVGRDHAAERRLGGRSPKRSRTHRLERQHLPALGDRRLDRRDRRPGPGAERHFGRRIEDDARHRRARQPARSPRAAGRVPPSRRRRRCRASSRRRRAASTASTTSASRSGLSASVMRPARRAETPWPG